MDIDGWVDQARRGASGPAASTVAAAQSIGEFIREQREAAQVSVRQLARLTGVSNPYLSQVERGLRKPSAEILQQIAHGLSLSAEQLYARAGLLEPREATTTSSDVVAAVLADPALSERHKHLLVEIYRSFVAETAPVATERTPTGGADTGPTRTGPTHTGLGVTDGTAPAGTPAAADPATDL